MFVLFLSTKELRQSRISQKIPNLSGLCRAPGPYVGHL